MECVPIRSKLIASAAYYPNAEKLCIWFHSGKFAWHENVTGEMFRNLANADSPGIYYSNYIRRRTVSVQKPRRWFGKLAVSLGFAAVVLSVTAPLNVMPKFHDVAVADASRHAD